VVGTISNPGGSGGKGKQRRGIQENVADSVPAGVQCESCRVLYAYGNGEKDDISLLYVTRNQEATDDGPDRSAPSDEELQAKLKRRRVSTMCFIGELFKAHLLSSVIVNYCVGELLKDINDEHVEFLCKLFQNVGGQLEQVRTVWCRMTPV
jgi:hypothetical protein